MSLTRDVPFSQYGEDATTVAAAGGALTQAAEGHTMVGLVVRYHRAFVVECPIFLPGGDLTSGNPQLVVETPLCFRRNVFARCEA